MTAIIIIFVVLFIITGIIANADQKQKQKNAEENARRQEENKIKRAKLEEEYKVAERQLISKYGPYTQRINRVWRPEKVSDNVYVFADAGVLFYDGKELSISNIIRCELSDNQTTRTTTSGGQVKQEFNLFEAVGKADAARMMFGKNSAQYAAANSANKIKIEPTKTTTIIIHNYTVNLYLKDLSNPCVPIKFGTQEESARKFVGVIEAIVAMRDNQNN